MQPSDVVRDDAYYAYRSTQQRFGDACNLIKGLLLRYVRRYSARLLNDRGGQDPARTSAREVLHIAGIVPETAGDAWLTERGFPTFGDVEEQLEGFRALIERRIEATYALEHPELMPPETIQAQFQLSEEELLLLCAVAAGQLNIEIARLYRFATGLDTTIFPAWFYADLLADSPEDRPKLLHLLEPDQPLRMFALIEVGQRTEWGIRTPVLQAPVNVPNRIAAFLMGDVSEVSIEYASLWCPDSQQRPELILPEQAVPQNAIPHGTLWCGWIRQASIYPRMCCSCGAKCTRSGFGVADTERNRTAFMDGGGSLVPRSTSKKSDDDF